MEAGEEEKAEAGGEPLEEGEAMAPDGGRRKEEEAWGRGSCSTRTA
jgi:hypothetical protein